MLYCFRGKMIYNELNELDCVIFTHAPTLRRAESNVVYKLKRKLKLESNAKTYLYGTFYTTKSK